MRSYRPALIIVGVSIKVYTPKAKSIITMWLHKHSWRTCTPTYLLQHGVDISRCGNGMTTRYRRFLHAQARPTWQIHTAADAGHVTIVAAMIGWRWRFWILVAAQRLGGFCSRNSTTLQWSCHDPIGTHVHTCMYISGGSMTFDSESRARSCRTKSYRTINCCYTVLEPLTINLVCFCTVFFGEPSNHADRFNTVPHSNYCSFIYTNSNSIELSNDVISTFWAHIEDRIFKLPTTPYSNNWICNVFAPDRRFPS